VFSEVNVEINIYSSIKNEQLNDLHYFTHKLRALQPRNFVKPWFTKIILSDEGIN
jgi:hypothetical protein